MRYSYTVEKSKQYKVHSIDFPDLTGGGRSEDAAFGDFLTKAFQHIRQCIKDGLPIPEDRTHDRDKIKTFGLPLNMTLKLKLHNIRLKKGVSKPELARFLLLTHDDVPDKSWHVDGLRKIPSAVAPKYKNVQRLFNIDHESTIREVEQAYRVLGYSIDVIPVEKNI